MATVIIASAWRSSARLVLPSPSSMTRPAAAVVAYRANRGYWHFVAGGGRPFHVSVDMGKSNGDAENDTRDMTSTKAPIRRDDIIELYDGVISDLYERGRVGGGGEGAGGGETQRWRNFPLNGGGPTGVFVKGTADEVVLSPSSDDDDGTSYREETDELDLAPIEDAICKSHYIEQAVVVRGADRPYNVALIVPDWVAEMAKSDGVRELIQSEIERNCYKIDKSRIPASFAIVAPFTAKNDTTAP
ncbi:hypothetical protein ACHAXA_005026 [Cyclostephanos tholiformis]|uniref:Uncharacterized protein n=1 Tax=Cyclostephanos tholiformis TaxID=382380 RepID=A0ABD3RYZ3_9STRA